MTELDRRHLFGAMAAAGGALASGGALAAPEILKFTDLKKDADVACLYHCDFGDLGRFSQMLVNIGNHYSAGGTNPLELQLCIVAHGAGVKFFMESLEGSPWAAEAEVPKIFERVEALAKNGLKIYLCDITFERQKLDREKARKNAFVRFVPSGVASVANLQSKGYAYIKTG